MRTLLATNVGYSSRRVNIGQRKPHAGAGHQAGTHKGYGAHKGYGTTYQAVVVRHDGAT